MDPDHRFLLKPNVRIYGPIDDKAVWDVLDQIQKVLASDERLVFELSTSGGDADAARRIGLEIRLLREWHERETLFVGKTFVMSAGITIMAAFPRNCRFLTSDTQLLIHERRIDRSVDVDGPMRANIQILSEQLESVKAAERVEKDGFAEFAAHSSISCDELYERAKSNFYLTAQEALEMRLIEAII
ncbi:peptidase S14 [Rhizobium leguminosarum]|uniref:ATP-dependent Clp protease proteolytic subunit n=1 Tax=Rhizobium leguminosarum TaxID=384 RepID=UPI001C91F429|nr:ATP-dependent Clp protease proteolytic subunit [Rhizobium leguminosarum]MBY3180062.1 peptidase S14 [Rhizobium leguminosarum]MBY5571866.1 peptidase S14 [Rhizobium leguminosarum]MBY5578402.1 peptidase S14 [Rhizobium leguminosarum]MBY5585087.1 peptidase S14 [Rhizobium leguminosarum]